MRRVNNTITPWLSSEKSRSTRGDKGRCPRRRGVGLGHPLSISNTQGLMLITSSICSRIIRRQLKVSFKWLLKSQRILITIWRTWNNTHWKKWNNLLQKQEIKILSLSLAICTKGSSLGSSKTWLKVWKRMRMKPLLRDLKIIYSETWKTFSNPITTSVYVFILRENLISTFLPLWCLRLNK